MAECALSSNTCALYKASWIFSSEIKLRNRIQAELGNFLHNPNVKNGKVKVSGQETQCVYAT